MKQGRRILLISSLLMVISYSGFCQETNSFNILKDDVESVLPPLGALIDSAIAHNPYVKFRDNQIVINQAKLKVSKGQWVKNIGVQSDVRYGTFNNFNNYTLTAGQTPDIYSSLVTQLNYGIGAFIRIPFDEFVTRKNQVKSAKTEVEQATNMAEVQRNELRQVVIKQYNELILRQRLLKIKSKYLEISRFNMEVAEKDFHAGVLTVNDYSRISELSAAAEIDFQTTKVEFNTAYLLLEEVVGTKFNLTNTIKN